MLETRNFLVPDATIVIETVAFVVVLVVMTRYVIPRIRDRMRVRQQAIDRSLASARAADRRRHETEAAAALITSQARREARQILEQAQAMREHLIAEGRRTGLTEYQWLAGRADRDLRRQTDMARRQARMAAAMAVRSHLGSDVDPATIGVLVDEALHTLGSPQPGLHTNSTASAAAVRN